MNSPPRHRKLNERPIGSGPVIYWMSRDQRVRDNHSLLFAAELAEEAETHVEVVFCLRRRCGAASRRHYEFMLAGLQEAEAALAELGIPFALTLGEPGDLASAGAVVCDFSPLRRARHRARAIKHVAAFEVDSRNIVPAWLAAEKHVYAAHNLRRRHAKMLDEFLVEIPAPPWQAKSFESATDWNSARAFVTAEEHGDPLDKPAGETAAHAALDGFVKERLPGYAELRGRADVDHQSGLSPYLHFGQLSAQRVALAARASGAPREDIDSFLDELITWRELSDNFCLNNASYANFDGLPDWGRKTLDEHAEDAREIVYDLAAFEAADTHDPLWNAAQLEMVRTGTMHNYMRMYWAKKILEWSESPREAMRIAVLLNDRYELDGRDPNGYAGIAWSIGGLHDRPWQERAVYGKVRYMNDNGARRKFDVDAYIERVAPELLEPKLF